MKQRDKFPGGTCYIGVGPSPEKLLLLIDYLLFGVHLGFSMSNFPLSSSLQEIYLPRQNIQSLLSLLETLSIFFPAPR